MKQNDTFTLEIRLRAYALKDVADLYVCSVKTMKTWLAPFDEAIGPRMGHYYTPKQMKIIFEKLGIPEIIPLK